jgi:hypothetical protein
MPNDRSNELYVQARQAEMMHTAQRHRLIAEVRPIRPRAAQFPARIYHMALAWFGRRLVTLGQVLQQKAKFPSPVKHG